MLMPLAACAACVGAAGQGRADPRSRTAAVRRAASRTPMRSSRLVTPMLAGLGLEAQPVKRDGLESADEAGASFMSMFSTFGSFSIAAGIMLIFLIFVMLAAERRTEMGVARAIGTRRGHSSRRFCSKGRRTTSSPRRSVRCSASRVSLRDGRRHRTALRRRRDDRTIEYSVEWPSVVVAYTLGVLLTFLGRRVLGLAGERAQHRHRRAQPARPGASTHRPTGAGWGGVALVAFGALLVVSGRSSGAGDAVHARAVALGRSASCRCCGRSAGRGPNRVHGSRTAMVVLWLLPFRVDRERRARRADGLLDLGRRRPPHRARRGVGRHRTTQNRPRRD